MVCDLVEVQDTKSFFANNILVHNCLVLDEFAFVPRNVAEDFYRSVYPTITSGTTTKIIMVSTPNGMNLFYKFWHDAKLKRNRYVPLEAFWWQVPGRDNAWKEEQLKNMTPEQFDQEMDCNFRSSSQNTLISSHVLKTLTYDNPIFSNSGLQVFDNPILPDDDEGEPGHNYVMCVDTSEGSNLDYHAFTVIDVTQYPYKVVATYRNNALPVMVYPTIIKNIAERYNNAYVLVEINNVGSEVSNGLYYDLEYEHVFATCKDKKFQVQQLSAGFNSASKLGLRMTHGSKMIGCSNLKGLIENNNLIVRDYNIISELTTFIEVKRTCWAGEPGTNDDLVMCLVMFGWLSNQRFFKDLYDHSINMKMTKEMTEESMMPPRFWSNIEEDPPEIF
jgi:hypothetical protein